MPQQPVLCLSSAKTPARCLSPLQFYGSWFPEPAGKSSAECFTKLNLHQLKDSFFFIIISFWIYVLLMSFSFLLVLKCPSVRKIVVMAGDIRNDHRFTTCESWWVTVGPAAPPAL